MALPEVERPTSKMVERWYGAADDAVNLFYFLFSSILYAEAAYACLTK